MEKSERNLIPVPKKPIRFGFLIAGLIFLVNPNVNLFDLLPDFLGCALILAAISTASDTLPYFAEARDRFRKLLWVNLTKIPALFLMMAIFSGDTSQRSIITVFAFSYAIIELIFLLPAFRSLYEGFFYMGERFGCDAALASDAKCRPDTLPRLTVLFFALRAAGSTLPEFALVPISDTGNSRYVAWYPFLAAAAFLIVLIFAILLSCRAVRYFRRLDADGQAAALIAGEAKERTEELSAKRTVRRIRLTAVVLTLAVGAGVDFIFDNINVLPDFLSGLFLLAAMLLLGYRGYLLAAPAAYTVTALVSYVLSVIYFTRYDYSSLYEKGNALKLYSVYLNVSLAELIASLACVAVLALVLLCLIPHVVGSLSGGESRQTAAVRRSLNREVFALTVVGVLGAAASYAYTILMQYTKSVAVDATASPSAQTSVQVPVLDWFWMVPLALALIRLALMLHFAVRVRAEVEVTYTEN